jgi:hypothetical protein
MLVLIDESGDPGFKLDKGSSPYFVVSMVVFSSFDEAERCSKAICELQSAYKIFPEFKFSNCREEIRDKFFECVKSYDFSIYALAVPKAAIYSKILRTDCDKFYNFFVRHLLTYRATLLKNAHVKIDESGDREFKRELIKYIRRMTPNGHIKKVTFRASKGDYLIQLADMVTGAIARIYSSKKDNTRWYGMIAHKVKNLWNFG